MIPESVPGPSWSLFRRVAFRFVFVYLVIYCLPTMVGVIPWTEGLSEGVRFVWGATGSWVAAHVLRLSQPVAMTISGSGDTTFDYVLLVCYFGIALLATLVWSLLDRKTRSYPKLYDGLRVFVRFVLAATMWAYGMSKVIPLQFSSPSPDRLLSTFGESSPMGLLWTFMGTSAAYTIFAGAGEVLGGLLLFFRRTTTLGALVLVAVMTNVVALNFCYDVPVKLYSLHLLLMAWFLILPDASRLLDVLFRNRPTAPREIGPPPGPRWLVISRRVAWVLFVGYVSYSNVTDNLEARHLYGDLVPQPAIYGVYEVEELSQNGAVVPAALGGPELWRRLSFNKFGGATLRWTGDRVDRFRVTVDPIHRTMTFTPFTPGSTYTLRYSRPAKDRLVLEGPFDGAPLKVRLKALPLGKSFLMTRGFHWINEFPLNR